MMIRQARWAAGFGLLLSLTASASPEQLCVSCQVPQLTAVQALGLESQIPSFGKAFGSFQPGQGLVPSQAPFEMPGLMGLSGGSTPPATPSWTERVQPGFLPQNFSLSWKAPVDPGSITWNWDAMSGPFGSFHPYAAMQSLWNAPTSPWAAQAAFWGGAGLSVPDAARNSTIFSAAGAR